MAIARPMTDNERKALGVEGWSVGAHRDRPWKAGEPEHRAGRRCDVFGVRDGKIQRSSIYLDPDYAGRDTARYPSLADGA